MPNSKATENIAKELEKTGVKVALTSGTKTGDLFTQKKTSDQQNLSIVYQVPCGSCDKSYIGETGRGVGKR